MKKFIVAGVVAVAAFGGGYVFLSTNAKSAAEEAIATIEKKIEAEIPNSDFTFGEVKANMFAGSATVSDLALKIDGTPLLTATALVVAGDDVTLKRAELIGIQGTYESGFDKVIYEANSLVLGDVDIAASKAFIEALKTNEAEATELLNSLSNSISDFTIEGLKLTGPAEGISVGLSNGSIEIADSVIKNFSLKGLDYASTYEEIDAKAGEVHFKGLDLSVDFTSETSVTENAARLYGMTDIGIKDASFKANGDEIGIANFSLSDVAIENGVIVKGKTSIDGLRIPLTAISEMDRSTARTIGDITGAENFVLSFSNAIDFDTTKGTYDTEIDFGAEGFAKVKIAVGLAGLDVLEIRKATQLTDFFELMNLWGAISEDLEMASVKLEYADENLLDTLLEKAYLPDTNDLVSMSGMQIDMFLGKYPEQAEQLKAAVIGFLNGKSSFTVSAIAENPVRLMKLQSLYASGGLTDAITFKFEGN